MSTLFAVHAITKEANEPIINVAKATMLKPVFIISAMLAKPLQQMLFETCYTNSLKVSPFF